MFGLSCPPQAVPAIAAGSGVDFQFSAKAVQDKRCPAYLAAARAKLRRARAVDTCRDDALFNAKDIVWLRYLPRV